MCISYNYLYDKRITATKPFFSGIVISKQYNYYPQFYWSTNRALYQVNSPCLDYWRRLRPPGRLRTACRALPPTPAKTASANSEPLWDLCQPENDEMKSKKSQCGISMLLFFYHMTASQLLLVEETRDYYLLIHRHWQLSNMPKWVNTFFFGNRCFDQEDIKKRARTFVMLHLLMSEM